MHKKTLFFVVAMALVAAPQFALADGDGAVTGVVGGAVAGAWSAACRSRRRRGCGRHNRKRRLGTRSPAMRHADHAKDE